MSTEHYVCVHLFCIVTTIVHLRFLHVHRENGVSLVVHVSGSKIASLFHLHKHTSLYLTPMNNNGSPHNDNSLRS